MIQTPYTGASPTAPADLVEGITQNREPGHEH